LRISASLASYDYILKSHREDIDVRPRTIQKVVTKILPRIRRDRELGKAELSRQGGRRAIDSLLVSSLFFAKMFPAGQAAAAKRLG
jgi:hypothetical protein